MESNLEMAIGNASVISKSDFEEWFQSDFEVGFRI